MSHQHEFGGDRFEYTPRRMLLSLVAISLGIVLCSIITVVVLDTACVSNAQEYMPIYPGSELVREEYSFLRPFGMGETLVVVDTDSPQREVLEWYRAMRQGGLPQNLLATMNFTVRSNEATGGSTIRLTSECAWR